MNLYRREGLTPFLTPCPVVDVGARLDAIIKAAGGEGAPCDVVILAREGEYVGMLDSSTLISLVNERELTAARDQNPLSRLPGNSMIHATVSRTLREPVISAAFVYFDFNDFKPFNDHYGFRKGDRVIILFSEILQKSIDPERDFVGHVGGDDFLAILSMEGRESDEITGMVRDIRDLFARDVASYYDREDRDAGGFFGRDRNGVRRRFPFLTTRAAVIVFDELDGPVPAEAFGREMARLKTEARESGIALYEAEDGSGPEPGFSVIAS
jgi:diguanylate cyclase (GGDEF)-like protein